jgi:cytoskeletal protein RodZ
VERETKIRRRYLEALKMKIGMCAENVYTKVFCGLLRFLNIDETEVMEAFKAGKDRNG